MIRLPSNKNRMYQIILLFISLFKSSHFYIIRMNRFQVHNLYTKNVLKYKNDKLSIVKNNTAKRESCPKCKRAKSGLKLFYIS
jgi:hypothetical protein